jgi:hypothetical protein
VLFVREVLLRGVVDPRTGLPEEPDEWQEKLLRAYGRYERRITVRSGHGVGKTAALAWVTVHHAVTEFPQKTALTAPTSNQMFVALWPEVGKWFAKCPDHIKNIFEFKSDEIVHQGNPKESFIRAATARPEKPEALAGVHCDDGSVLLIADESSGIHEAIFESASGSMSGHTATTILAGNPLRTAGLFFDSHMKPEMRDFWFALHVSCEQCRRVKADFLEDMRRRYGVNSNQYRVRVLGEFPKADADTVIPFESIEAATIRDVTPSPAAPMIWGLDPARFGGDRSALVKRKGNAVPELPKVWQDLDLMQLSAMVKIEWDTTDISKRPAEILVDSIGLGAGVVDRLRQLELPVRGINVSESPSMKDHYSNLKAELWFEGAKAWFQKLDCTLPKDIAHTPNGSLCGELALPRFKFTKTGKLQVESKDEIKKRGFASPDLADAFILTFASSAATMAFGSANQPGWNQPMRRNIKGMQGI